MVEKKRFIKSYAQGSVKQKCALKNKQNAQIQIILCIQAFVLHTFCSIQWFC